MQIWTLRAQGLRQLLPILEREGVQSIFPANHGIAWSIYCHDPDGNNLELFVDTEWYMPQPFLIPLDFSQTDQEIYDETHRLAKGSPVWMSLKAVDVDVYATASH